MTSPTMQQYDQLKAQCPDAILLFRIGDFFEAFDEDAKTVARVLGLPLTSRGVRPMAGFPHHQIQSYTHKLIQAGLRVAVRDQVQ